MSSFRRAIFLHKFVFWSYLFCISVGKLACFKKSVFWTSLMLQLYFKKRLWNRGFPVNFAQFIRHLFSRTPLDGNFWNWYWERCMEIQPGVKNFQPRLKIHFKINSCKSFIYLFNYLFIYLLFFNTFNWVETFSPNRKSSYYQTCRCLTEF